MSSGWTGATRSEIEIDTPLVTSRVDAEGSAEIESRYGRQAARGTLWAFAVHILLLPLGFLTSVFLTRRLGPELFGVFSVIASIVFWIEVSVGGMFGKTTVKFVAEAADWKEVASALMQARFVVSLGGTALLLMAAPVLASWLKSPELTVYLRLFALEIPISSLARAHLSTLTGRRAFGRLALLTAVYGSSRIVLVLLLVGLGLSLTGAILANIGAFLLQLAFARMYVRPAIRARAPVPMRLVARYAQPLLLYTVGRSLLYRLDLLVVKALVGTSAAGYYGAAQGLTRPLGLFVVSLTPPLLATLARMLQDERTDSAHSMIGQATRLVLWFLPFVAMVAGSASEIIGVVYGQAFAPAAPLLALLLFSSVGGAVSAVNAEVFMALGRPGWTFALTLPLLPLAYGAHLIAVPRFGPTGAAAVMTAFSWLGASAMMLVVYWQTGIHAAPVTILRITVTSLIAYALSSIWKSSGAWVILELSVVAGITLVCLLLLGELTSQDLSFVMSVVRRERA